MLKIAVAIAATGLLMTGCAPKLFDTAPPVSAQAERGKTAPDRLNGTWRIVKINGAAVVDPGGSQSQRGPATLSFADGTVSAYAFCNQMGGDYTAGPGTIQTGTIMATLMACSDGMDQESAVGEILRGAATFSVSNSGVLTVATADGRMLTAVK